LRRKKPEIGDIELVAIRSEGPLFHTGIEQVLDRYKKIKGDAANGKYCQREPPEGIKLDVFFCTPENWGLIFCIRTGSANFSKWFIGTMLPRKGYLSREGMLYKNGIQINVPEEEDIFKFAGINYIEPEKRI
jgi:DNA polymerase/3'-5' exonuclease PolX